MTKPMIAKPFASLMSALFLVAAVQADPVRGTDTKPKDENQHQEKERKDKEKKDKKDAKDKKCTAVKEILDSKDKNNDGSLSLDEFLTGETEAAAATEKFNAANKNGDRFLSRGEIADMLGL